MKLDEGDSLVGVSTCREGDDVMLATRGGKCIRFTADADTLRVFAGRDSTGVRGIKLAQGDAVTARCHFDAAIILGTLTGPDAGEARLDRARALVAIASSASRVRPERISARRLGDSSACGRWIAAPCPASHCALSRWWEVVDTISGTRMLATPATAIAQLKTIKWDGTAVWP